MRAKTSCSQSSASEPATAGVYAVATIGGGLAAVWIGLAVVRALLDDWLTETAA